METHIMERPTGAVAIKLDADILLTRARAAEAARLEDEVFDPATLTHGPGPQMLIAVDRGVAAVINGEGVGEVEQDVDRIDVWFTRYGMWETVPLSLADINAAATEETIDLADGIRRFGDRLDMNFFRWFSRYDRDHRPA
ncbi:hypothetical protein C5E10_13440 [Pseudoclavibacter sp. RFBG4]|uniref:hypothetical protein n=1 Tax=Pseudoclavibacter sp. RFBG4 TaxID=2080575 RepID=UPI000CE7EA29|nr:hypothetical protein [Pseudoclavibacter sp. RFBG4]PPG28591.1 hypothetical protein C5E10_13440 [Pseudoclavibacter sp. RFBG4]